MKKYPFKTFSIPSLDGISEKQIAEHLKLYEGYVKHTNLLQEKIKGLSPEVDGYLIQEVERRFGFEFGGMRLHEYYFGALEDGSAAFDASSVVGKVLTDQFKSYDKFVEVFTHYGKTRGSGWTLLYWDAVAEQFLIHWADEHHLGHLATLPVVIALDCWEHAYMVDHLPSGRGEYIDAYLKNLNWKTVDSWFSSYR